MKKTLLLATALVALATSAHAKDLMVVIMKEDKTGQVQMHHQPSNDCMTFLREFEQRHAKGEKVKLKFEAPPVVNGEVIEVNCIHEDGSNSISKKTK
jgi:hypothetical protein